MKTTSENYVGHAVRTDCVYNEELLKRLTDSARLLHAAIGLATESGEFLDMLKKHIFYGKPLDATNAIEENGDALWYIALALDELAVTMNAVMTLNINKLKLRYPVKFTEVDANDRNIEAERDLLESRHGYADITDAEYCRMNNIRHVKPELSKRGQDWLEFSEMILAHIEEYTVPQYGDKGEDQVTSWTAKERVEQAKKYLNRFGKNQRPGQETLDFFKSAHYCQLAFEKYQEEQNASD